MGKQEKTAWTKPTMVELDANTSDIEAAIGMNTDGGMASTDS